MQTSEYDNLLKQNQNKQMTKPFQNSQNSVVNKNANVISIDRLLFLDKYLQKQENNNINSQINKIVSQNLREELNVANSDKVLNAKKEISISIGQSFANNILQAREAQSAISSQQSSFMSNVAKNIYANYKPPVTAIRINLNPAMLGSLDVIIKSTKEGISVSINASNHSTLEMFEQNRALLQQELAKISDSANLSLSFGFSGEQQNTSSNSNSNKNFKQNNNENNINNANTQKANEENLLETSNSLAYM
jgi:hypothetical protein